MQIVCLSSRLLFDPVWIKVWMKNFVGLQASLTLSVQGLSMALPQNGRVNPSGKNVFKWDPGIVLPLGISFFRTISPTVWKHWLSSVCGPSIIRIPCLYIDLMALRHIMAIKYAWAAEFQGFSWWEWWTSWFVHRKLFLGLVLRDSELEILLHVLSFQFIYNIESSRKNFHKFSWTKTSTALYNSWYCLTMSTPIDKRMNVCPKCAVIM